jgi:hypothetical protein
MDEFAGVVAVFHKFSVQLKLQGRGNPNAGQGRGEAKTAYTLGEMPPVRCLRDSPHSE